MCAKEQRNTLCFQIQRHIDKLFPQFIHLKLSVHIEHFQKCYSLTKRQQPFKPTGLSLLISRLMFYDKTIKDRQRERERERNIEKRRLFLEFIAMLVPLPAFILIALYLSKAYYYYFSFFRLLKSVISILAGFFLLQHQHSLC